MKNKLRHRTNQILAYLSLIPLSLSSITIPVEAETDTVIAQSNRNNSIICESRNGRRYRCQFSAPNGVELVEQLSRGSCEGKWLYDSRREYLEVWDGCQARFQEIRYSGGGNNNNNNWGGSGDTSGSNTIVCGSEKGRTNRCNFNAPNGIEVVKVMSNASCKGNWSYDRRRRFIEVRDGCRAEFRALNNNNNNNWGGSGGSNNSRTVICESEKGRSQRCNMNTRNGVTLTRQLSEASCRGNWFFGDGFVEVKNGCRAEFSQGNSNNSFAQEEYDRGYRDGNQGRRYDNHNNTQQYDRGYQNGRRR